MPAPDKLSLIVFSGDYDRIHFALITASAAAATGRAVTLFFTMKGTRALATPPGDGSRDWAVLDGAHAEKGIATVEEMLEALVALGATFMACETGLKAESLTSADLRPDIKVRKGGVVTFLNDCDQAGSILFI